MYLLVRVFVSLQGLHDGELGVVFEAGRLVPQNFFQHTQGQSSDGVLGGGRDMSHQSEVEVSCSVKDLVYLHCLLSLKLLEIISRQIPTLYAN